MLNKISATATEFLLIIKSNQYLGREEAHDFISLGNNSYHMMHVRTHWFHIMSGFVIQPHSSKMIMDPADDHDGYMGCEEHNGEWRVRHV